MTTNTHSYYDEGKVRSIARSLPWAVTLICLTGIPRIYVDTEQNNAIARLAVEEVWNKGKLDVVDEILSADWINHDPDYTGR